MTPSMKKSLILHVVVLLLLVIDLPMFWNTKTSVNQVPIIVDLQNVDISEMTNLPPKAKVGKENKKASVVKRKVEDAYTQEEPKEKEKKSDKKDSKQEKEEISPKDAEPKKIKQDFLVAPQPKKPRPPKVKAKPKPKEKVKRVVKKPAKKITKPKDKAKPQLANPLKSLLASVDALEKEEGNKSELATLTESLSNMGIEGGVGGSYLSQLSISEIDAIAGRLRGCWNIDPGARGIEDMLIEVRAYLNQDGSVRKVEILDSSRYGSDTHFRSVADSAMRAVHICAPYTIFADKYLDRYDTWKTMLLRFNPMDATVK